MLEGLATICAGIFAGAAIFISLVEHPASLAVGDAATATFFPHMYRRGAPMQASLALVGTVAGIGAWLSGSGVVWLVGALLLGFVVPFTLIRMKPVNDQLLDPALDPAAPQVPGLLRSWGTLHGVRSASSGLAFLLFVLG